MRTGGMVDLGGPSVDAERRTVELLHEHRQGVFAHALRLCGGDVAWAEDVVQETFIRAWRHWDQLTEDRGSVRAWLMRVAHNLVMDEYRTARRRHGQVPLGAAVDVAVPETSDDLVLSAALRDAVSRLPDLHRRALEATFLSDRTAQQAASLLGIPSGTVKSRVFYGLRRLREVIDPVAA